MIYLKTYEELNIDEPKVGDWVICYATFNIDDELKKFLSTAIGKIQDRNARSVFNYGVYFEYMPKSLDEWGNSIDFQKSEIKYWSENKEDLEYIIAVNKYNI